MSDPKPQNDPNPVGDPKPESAPKPEGDPNPEAPGQEIGDRPGNAGQHPGMPPDVDARKGSAGNTAGDRGAREPASR